MYARPGWEEVWEVRGGAAEGSCSPKVQPVERLWPLINNPFTNRVCLASKTWRILSRVGAVSLLPRPTIAVPAWETYRLVNPQHRMVSLLPGRQTYLSRYQHVLSVKFHVGSFLDK